MGEALHVRYELMEGGKLTKGSMGAAAFDLHASETVELEPGGCATIGTNLKLEIPSILCGIVTMRSGLGFRKDLDCHDGLIDSDYRGEVGVRVRNFGNQSYLIEKGAKFAQIRFAFSPPIQMEEAFDGLTDTQRGGNGFGSTGK